MSATTPTGSSASASDSGSGVGSEVGSGVGSAAASVDGRSRRWDEHRTTRRRELVDATMRAIRHHGAGVGMDDIAAEAATSKTVFYRHFTDRAGLYAAVTERVADTILHDLIEAEGGSHEAPSRDGQGLGRAVVARAIDAYLRLVEEEPQIYRFVVTAPLLDRAGAGDPSASVSTRVAEHLTEQFEAWLNTSVPADGRLTGANPAGTRELTDHGRHRARVWAHGVVGMVRAAADDWLMAEHDVRVSREHLTALLTDLAWSGLSA